MQDNSGARSAQLMSYVGRGWALTPLHDVSAGVCSCKAGEGCRSAGKHPRVEEWQRPDNLVRDADGLRAALQRWPHSNWGLATGLISGVWALDYDPKSVDPARSAEVDAILAACWESTGWIQQTGSLGLHFLFTLPEDFIPNNGTGSLPPGLDVRGARRGQVGGGQIVVAPSVSAKGAYVLLRDGVPGAPPAMVLDMVRPAPPRAATPSPGSIAVMASADQIGRYVTRAINDELAELSACWHQRNQRAWRAAARCIELINTGAVPGEPVFAAWWAAGMAHPDVTVTVPDIELLRVWSSAERHVGDRPADLSAVGGPRGWMGGDAIRPPAAPGAMPSSAGGPGATGGSTASYPQGYAQAVDSPGYSTGTDASVPVSSLLSKELPTAYGLTLPEEFWSARPVLKHIRQAAWARTVSADVVLYSVLARLAALWTPSVRLDTGVKSPASANLFVAVTGPSGAGKSSGISVVADLLGVPAWLQSDDAFRDDVPLGSGEGVAEAYMGTVWVPTSKLGGDGLPLVDKATGAVKMEKARGQVRGNVLMNVDEGEVLNRMLQRQGATIGETLRRAWVGATLGQANGKEETTRIVQGGRYSLGLLIGFQVETALPLLQDSAAGTPQRFLWCWTVDPDMPEEEVPDPGRLSGIWPPSWSPGQAAIIGANVGGGPTAPRPDVRPVTFSPEIRRYLRGLHYGLVTGRQSLPEMDAHMPLTLVKVSTLLAALEGRRDITDEDWALARVVWHTSCAVRDHLLAHAQESAGKAQAAAAALAKSRAYDAEHARGDAADERDQRAIERVARWLYGKIGAKPGSKIYIYRKLAGRDRGIVNDALEYAKAFGWIVEDDDEALRLGHSQPARPNQGGA